MGKALAGEAWWADAGTRAALAVLCLAWLTLVVCLFDFMSHTPFVVIFVFPGALAWLHRANGRTTDKNRHRLNVGALLLASALFYVTAAWVNTRSFGFAQCEYSPESTRRTHPVTRYTHGRFVDGDAPLQKLLEPLLPVLDSGAFGLWALTAGSLLGLERGRTLNPYEVDVDIVLEHPERALESANQELLRQRGLFAFRWCGAEWWRCSIVRVCRRSTHLGASRWLGVKAPQKGRYLPYVDLYQALPRRPQAFCPKDTEMLQPPLRTVELKSGLRVKAPGVELSRHFLQCTFGDWRAYPEHDHIP